MKKYYSTARVLHLYLGLFISPLILIFSISVLVINHTEYFNKLRPKKELESLHTQLHDFQMLGTDLLTAKAIIQQLNISGEIDWISKTDSTISFPVNKPGLNKRISVNTRTGVVLISQQDMGTLNGMTYLHTMPGEHNAKLRGNSFFMQAWRIATDVVVYVVLFVSATGIFMWYFLRPEKKLGMFSLGMGALIFLVLMMLLF